MYRIVETRDFRKSYRRLLQSGQFAPKSKARAAYRKILECLQNGKKLPAQFRDHKLSGEYAGYKECHIKGDLLLVYEVRDDVLILVLVDIGSHSELFG